MAVPPEPSVEVPRDRRSQAPHGPAIANPWTGLFDARVHPNLRHSTPLPNTPQNPCLLDTDLTDPVALPDADAATVLIFEQGLQHERRHPASLKARGFTVVEIPGEGFDIDERTTRAEESRCGAGLR